MSEDGWDEAVTAGAETVAGIAGVSRVGSRRGDRDIRTWPTSGEESFVGDRVRRGLFATSTARVGR